MTTTAYAGDALVTLVSVFALWMLLFVLFRDYRVDALRQRLFNLRGELFDFAESGAIAFDHPAYTQLRGRVNHLIRFSHRLTTWQFLIVVLEARHDGPVERLPLEQWTESVQTIEDGEVRQQLCGFNNRLLGTLVWHLVTGSFLISGSLVLFGFCWLLKHLMELATRRVAVTATEIMRRLFDGYVRRTGVEQMEAQAQDADALAA